MSSESMNRAYIKKQIDPILEPIVTAIFMHRPEDQVQFMMNYLSETHGKRLSVNANEQVELQFLRQQMEKHNESKIMTQRQVGSDDDEGSDNLHSSSDDSEDDEHVSELPDAQKKS